MVVATKQKVKAKAKLIGSAASGVIEIGLFHPVDTVAKRLMSNQATVSMQTANGIIFRQAASQPLLGKWTSLYPGLNFAAAYKILQRTYKFGGQPIMKQQLDAKFGNAFRGAFGNKGGQDAMHACSGSLIGLGEVALLPLDVLKIKAQVSGNACWRSILKGVTLRELYAGWGWTAARNMPGSFMLFGVNSFAYTRVLGISGPSEATFGQIFFASLCGGTASIVSSSPMDVIKTRIQNKPFGESRSGMSYLTALLHEEGPGALFKGVTPKVGLVGPKLVFSFTIAQWLIVQLNQTL